MTTDFFDDVKTSEAEQYLLLVRAEMLHLPPEDFLDLLDDVEAHVHAVALEGGRLDERLGTPSEFVRELLASADLGHGPVGQPKERRLFPQRAQGRPRLNVSFDEWVPPPLQGLGPDLRRGWWVARGAALPLLIFGLSFAGIVVGLVGVVASVKLGSLLRGRFSQFANFALTVGAAIALPFVLSPGTQYVNNSTTTWLNQDGEPIGQEFCAGDDGCHITDLPPADFAEYPITTEPSVATTVLAGDG